MVFKMLSSLQDDVRFEVQPHEAGVECRRTRARAGTYTCWLPGVDRSDTSADVYSDFGRRLGRFRRG